MDLHNSNYGVMELHNWIMELHKWIMELRDYVFFVVPFGTPYYYTCKTTYELHMHYPFLRVIVEKIYSLQWNAS